MLSGSRCAMCQVGNQSKRAQVGLMGDMCHHMIEWKSKVDGFMDKGNSKEPIG